MFSVTIYQREDQLILVLIRIDGWMDEGIPFEGHYEVNHSLHEYYSREIEDKDNNGQEGEERDNPRNP